MGTEPLVSVVIPTRDRPQLLERAVASVLAQTVGDVELVIVDDGSTTAVERPDDPRVRVLHHATSRGLAASLNDGIRAATGRYVAHLDDDDRFRPDMLERSLSALEASTLPGPTAVVSGIESFDVNGVVVDRRIPPTRARGAHWSLEPLEAGFAYEVRNTMVVERGVLLRLGLFDEALRSSIRHELFLRLNPVCSILGVREVTYDHLGHTGARVSEDLATKHESFAYIEAKHRELLRAHPARYADYLLLDARRLRAMGRSREAAMRIAQVARVAPGRVAGIAGRRLRAVSWRRGSAPGR